MRVFEHFLWLLVQYECPYALLLIADRAQASGMPAKEWLKSIVEKELAKEGQSETQAGTQGT